jgi:DNA-binding MarR family transcriptional regulator
MEQADEQPLGYVLCRVMATLRPEVISALKPLGLALPDFVCLRTLSMSPGGSNAELAREANVSPQAMNIVLRGLEDRGAVTRPGSASSGRALPAQLTNKGRALLKRADATVTATDERVLAALTPDQRRRFRQLLEALSTT